MRNIFNVKSLSAVLPSANTPETKFKSEVIRLVNIERRKYGVAELGVMEAVEAIADIRARESAESFLHTRPDGSRCFTVFSEHTLRYTAAGENLAYGYKTPQAAVTAWMRSAGHRKNILDPDFNFIGAGYYLNEKKIIFCTTLFYTPALGR
jgi:uncharacterized protein YkwD